MMQTMAGPSVPGNVPFDPVQGSMALHNPQQSRVMALLQRIQGSPVWDRLMAGGNGPPGGAQPPGMAQRLPWLQAVQAQMPQQAPGLPADPAASPMQQQGWREQGWGAGDVFGSGFGG
jgi:hypothetical protein